MITKLEFATTKILIVDDEQLNLELLEVELSDVGYEIVKASDGVEALEMLEKHPDVTVICLDRMMPNMDGLTCCEKIKADDRFKDIPIIMQTAAATDEQVREGIKAGVYYYLTKPFLAETLVAIVKSAVQDRKSKDDLHRLAKSGVNLIGLMQQSEFKLKTISEARDIAFVLSRAMPQSDRVILGLTELLINAIEHGNLGISYEEKKDLLIKDCWQEEVDRRLSLPENAEKFVTLTFTADESGYHISIRDQGEGFRWQDFVEFDVYRAMDPNGRGIFLARTTGFDDMNYNQVGNEVTCFVAREEGKQRFVA